MVVTVPGVGLSMVVTHLPDEVVLLFGPMTENGPNRGNQ